MVSITNKALTKRQTIAIKKKIKKLVNGIVFHAIKLTQHGKESDVKTESCSDFPLI